ncbi:MAG: hypothetical protein HY363_01135 [Candidatus Aenigmarchaeota archaeon]|nr:hypothetical protein [Candidatus Aenigmarchaeota archaeon]
MKIIQKLIIPKCIRAGVCIINNPLALLASALVDVLALVMFGYLSAPVYAKLTEHIIIIGTLVSQKLQPARGQSVLTALYSVDISGFVKQMFLLLGLLLMIVYVLFAISQGVNFSIAKYMMNRKTAIIEEITTTAKTAAVWSIILAGAYFIRTVAEIRQVIVSKFSEGIGFMQVLEGIEVLLIITALATFAAGSFRKGVLWISNQKLLFLYCIGITLLLFGAISIALRLLGSINPMLVLLGGLFLFFPALAWLRIFFIQITAEMTRKAEA